ncbi:MAG: glycerophosphodiester phosphodiesterase family protein [Clostridia bacterium]|nr:glycerophosphodiester phosphodiesterase family protein [Clostridia bacterium]
MRLTRDDRMSIAGHRGDSYNYYENTMTAFKKAVEEGADMIETDVRLTKDNILVIMHDERVDRTTNSRGKVSEICYEDIAILNAGDSINYEQVPTFYEFINWASKENITLNIEIKEYYSEENSKRCIKCIEDIIDLVEQFNMTNRVVLNSFDAWVLEYIYRKYGKKYLLHGFYPYNEMFNVNIDPTEYLYCACIWEIDNKEIYKFLSDHNIEIWVGAGVTQISKLKTCIENGAKLITTNNPGDIKNKLIAMEKY